MREVCSTGVRGTGGGLFGAALLGGAILAAGVVVAQERLVPGLYPAPYTGLPSGPGFGRLPPRDAVPGTQGLEDLGLEDPAGDRTLDQGGAGQAGAGQAGAGQGGADQDGAGQGGAGTPPPLPNPLLTLTFGTTLTVDDNRNLDPVSEGTTTFLDNRIGLRYLTETPVSLFGIEADGVLRIADQPGGSGGTDTAFDDRSARLRYAREGAVSRLSLGARYDRNSVAFFDPLTLIDDPATPIDESDLDTGDDGFRIARSATLDAETGIDAPFGLFLSARVFERSYEDTTDPDFFDTSRSELSLGTTLRPTGRTTLSFTLSQTDFSAEDVEETERRTRRAIFGVNHALRPDTDLVFSLGTTRIVLDETILGLRTRTVDDGLNGSLGLTRALPNGTAGLRLTHDVSTDGDRTSLLLSRDLQLARGGTLAASFGPTVQSGETGLIGTLAYGQPLPRGRVSATIDRRIGSNDEEETVDSTRLRLGLTRDLTPLSGLDLSLDYLETDSEAAGEDRSRARLQAAYTLDLAQDWQLRGGISRTVSDRETTGTARSNSVFLTIGKSFVFAP